MNAFASVAGFFCLGSRARNQIGFVQTSIRRSEERGSSLVEMAICVPILLMLVTGITSFGIVLNNYLMLTSAVEVGGRQLAIIRGNSLDPCKDVATTIATASPLLKSANLKFTFNFNGTAYSNLTYPAGATCTAGAALVTESLPMQVLVTYPCSLSIYGKNLIPNCSLTAQVTELEQ
jgi:Flp pilus assembly protein TadG